MQTRELKTGIKVGYGLAEMGTAAAELMIQLYLLKFFVEVVGLSPAIAAGTLALAVGLDAITDLFMGRISDRTNPPGGRRRFYILLGGLLLAVALPALFHNPEFTGTLSRAIYLFCAYVAVSTAMTIISVPHAALGGELSSDPEVRTHLYAYRLLWGTVGLLAGTIIPGLVLEYLQGQAEQTSAEEKNILADASLWAAFVVSAMTIVSAWLTFKITRGYDNTPQLDQSQEHAGFGRSILQAMQNKTFRPLLTAFFIANLGRTMNASIALLYYKHFLGLPESQVSVYILGLFILTMCLSIPIWVALAARVGKKWPAFGGALGLGLMTMFTYPFFPEGSLTGPLFCAVLGGFLAASVLLYDALVADIVDYDSVYSRENRDGLYFGFWKMAARLSRLAGLAGVGLALQWAGLQEGNVAQSDETATRLSYLFGPGVGSLFVVGALIFSLLPWSNQIHDQVRRILRKRSSAATSE